MNYWQKRNKKAIDALAKKNIKETEDRLKKYYSAAMKNVIEQFEATYNKVLLAAGEGRKPTPADLYKLDTYWKMQGQLQKELQKLGDRETVLLGKKFKEAFVTAYSTLAIPSQPHYSQIDDALVTQMINRIWVADGKSWSQRIWTNTERLREVLNENLVNCVVTGKNTTQLKKTLQEEFAVSYSQADSLVRTEISHIQNEAARKRYEDAGITEVEVWADEDERLCEHCGQMHEKRFSIHDTANLPPFHPRCRCSILPVI